AARRASRRRGRSARGWRRGVGCARTWQVSFDLPRARCPRSEETLGNREAARSDGAHSRRVQYSPLQRASQALHAVGEPIPFRSEAPAHVALARGAEGRPGRKAEPVLAQQALAEGEAV